MVSGGARLFTGRPARLAGAVLGLFLALQARGAGGASPLDRIVLPPGFAIELYARVPGARSMVVVEELGVVFVGTRGSRVYAVADVDGDRLADAVFPVLDGLNGANGIAWRDGRLFVAEQHRVVSFAAADINTLGVTRPHVLFDGLPDKSHHGWRYAALGPDGGLYVAVGAPCNICRGRGLEGTIVRLDADSGLPRVFARGVRNSVGMDFHPLSGELYFTDNGADGMGDDSPPDELNHAPRAGLHFGFPYYGGGAVRTPDFEGEAAPPNEMPVVRFGAHVAALGMHFYRGRQFPPEYRSDAFVAQHGSWNRSVPDGYRVARVHFDGRGRAQGWEPFAEGWLVGGRAWGRPVDVKELGDGSLLVSDDRVGAIYRITYRGR